MKAKKEYKVVECPECHGTGIWELEGGLISGECPKCKGRGSVRHLIKVEAAEGTSDQAKEAVEESARVSQEAVDRSEETSDQAKETDET